MRNETVLRDYLRDVERAYRAGNATEHTYRPYLKTLLQSLAPNITAVNEPKRIACGAPDYALTRKDMSGPRTIGYVEAKDIGVSLDETLRTDQLKRYFASLDNLILTDYLEFRWYVRRDNQMEHQRTARIASVGSGRTLAWDADGAARVADMLVAMLGRSAPDITSPDELARRMARIAHMIRDVALDTLRSADTPEREQVRAARDELTDLFQTFKNTLIPDLTDDAFADMFAQTLAYGLFAARYSHSGAQPFTRHDAAREIPRSNPFLRRLFAAIESPDLEDAPYIGFVDDLAQLLATTDMATVLRDFGKRTRTEDPIVHFYEPFLQAYDPRLREVRGVYYTPDPVVSYITRSVDTLLKRDFQASAGLADERVVTLDPACGTATFLSSVLDLIRERFQAGNNAGAWPGYVRERLLPRVFGFELLMAPYAMAHLRLGMQLAGLDLPEGERARWAFQAGEGERLGVYLTNTLDQAAKQSEHLFRGQFITDEANAATRIKRDAPVMVVLGNPPYSGHSANNGDWIMWLLRGEDLTNTQGDKPLDRGKGRPTDNYFMVDGQPLGERNSKWLNDDYVKFIRFAQWRIERSGYGVLAFVTNHGYLDNPTFRGMRQSLMRTFDDIYVLDLHGNSKKKERTPEGGADQNVFDIQQGVAIGLFVRRRGAATGDRHATVHHAHLYGERTAKYDWLAAHDVVTTEWAEVKPTSPMYFFIPRDARLASEYNGYKAVPEVFGSGNPKYDGGKAYGLGIVTHNDEFFVGWSQSELHARVQMMASTTISDDEIRANLPVADSPYWDTARERGKIRKSDWANNIWPLYYRPFDWRHVYYEPDLMEIGRGGASRNVMPHAKRNSRILMVSRGFEIDRFEHVLVANAVAVHHAATRKEGNYVFPLYLYPNPSGSGLWSDEVLPNSPGGRRANLAPEFIRDFSARLGLAWVADGKGDCVATFGPEDVFAYIYAILHAPSYRERYADFLKSDFPRVPLTRDTDLFRALCALGDRLVALHLMEATAPGQPSFPIGGDNRVEAVRYLDPDAAQGRAGQVYINQAQYFDGVTPEVWAFHIGGYQVAEKWLKDRKSRTLAYGDIEHYANTIAALAETARLMEQIDETIEDHGGWPLDAAEVSDASA